MSAPKKTSKNSHTPPSSGFKGKTSSGKTGKKKPRPSRPGTSRRLADNPDTVLRQQATSCTGCGADVSNQRQHLRHRYDHVDIPPVTPHTTRIELMGGRCNGCGCRFRAPPPEGMKPGTPFGPNIHAFLLYLHHSHHIGFERLSRVMSELFGLKISEGAISNAFQRMADPLEKSRDAIRKTLREAQVIASDETTTRINGQTHWHWVFVSGKAVLHEIAPRRAKAVAEGVLDGHCPDVWISDRYAGQQEMAGAHQVCLAPSRRCFASPAGQCTSFAMFNTPSIAATASSPQRYATFCVGQSVSAGGETRSRTPRWNSISERPSAS